MGDTRLISLTQIHAHTYKSMYMNTRNCSHAHSCIHLAIYALRYTHARTHALHTRTTHTHTTHTRTTHTRTTHTHTHHTHYTHHTHHTHHAHHAHHAHAHTTRTVALQNTYFSCTHVVTRNWRTYFISVRRVFLVDTVVLQTVLWDIRAWIACFLVFWNLSQSIL